MKEFIYELNKIDKTYVRVYIEHKLYGDQNIKCAFHIINDEERLGFSVNKQDIYIYKKEIINFKLKNGLYYFADQIMSITIRKLHEQ